ncbi:ATP synthase gamma chain [Candidatus Annandia adelgestsuga]|uniref:ATP synthase gamma chain n=1 Tax=Candidatus Annandia adelgestsuga TaxID=1302411 RepID=A0A3Q9CM49_9ENTR|nr:ATP synthase F1 subunit gamma [Candidatus Annandia adelgestsuga]AZP36230.1 ATP synthase gamma chain [Candidatus Annandia adelgestsuga]
MNNIKIIKDKINSINNTKKITKVMEMVATNKMFKTKKNIERCKPYIKSIEKVIKNLLSGNPEYKHHYFKKKKIKKVGFIIVSSDRGLCGSLNNLLFKKILNKIIYFNKKNINVVFSIIGSKGASFFRYLNYKILSQYNNLSIKPKIIDIIGLIKSILNLYDNNKIEKLYISYNKYYNTMIQIPKITKLLPISFSKNKKIYKNRWDYIYENDSKFLLNTLLVRYIESKIYNCVLENIASEQSSRMIAMKSATENSNKIILELKLLYNKIRQSNITKELNEIISSTLIF